MTAPQDAFEAGLRIAGALDEARVPYAIGGALAYGQYGIPRATNDVDVNLFVEVDALPPVVETLETLGIELDRARVRQQAEEEGLVVGRWGLFRIDLFTPSIPFSWEAERTRVRHVIDGAPVWFLSAEALCVFKLLYFRGKDLVDLERLLAVHGPALDTAYVRQRIVEMLGDDDPRVAAWDRICAAGSPR